MKYTFSGSDIAAAFGRPDPETKCWCKHKRWEHRRVVKVDPGGDPFKGTEEHFECEHWDRRRKSGMCICKGFDAADLGGLEVL